MPVSEWDKVEGSGVVIPTDVTAGKLLANGPDDVVPNHLAHGAQMLLGERVFVHERVHGRKDVSWGRWCQST